MKTKFVIAATSAALFAMPASAQETSFAGAHVAALAGYDSVDLNIAGVDNPDGFLYGVAAGYDLQSGNAVYGIEVEAADSTSKIEFGGATVAKTKRDLYAGVRVGYAMGPALIYAKGGYTNARVEALGTSANGDGFRLGAGVDYMLGANMFVRGEYRYSNYEADVERHQLLAGLGFRF